MLRSNPFHSIRWRILAAYFLAIAMSLLVIFILVSGLVEDYMVQRAASEYIETVQNYSVQIAPMLAKADADSMLDLSKQAGNELEGRILVLDYGAIVQIDGFSVLNGRKLTNTEVTKVLSGVSDHEYGFRLLDVDEERVPAYSNNWIGTLQRLIGKSVRDMEWVIYCTAPIVSESEIIGCIVLSVSIENIVEQTTLIRWQMLIVFIITGMIVLLISALISGAMVKPIRDLTQGIKRISQGDFRHRVSIDGHSELAQMAITFNNMSQQLEDIDRTRNEFVSNASHELKTPMASIKVLVETLQHQNVYNADMTEEFLGDINGEIDRLTMLVNELIALVKQDEAGSTMLNLAETNMTDLCIDVCSKLKPIATTKDINLYTDIQKNAIILGDVKLLRRMLINIIENAIKYTPNKGSVTVTLSQDQNNCNIVVLDTGIGIPDEQIPYIFDRFYRVDKARARETGGSGLGLSIVKSIARLHNGSINVDSQIDKGTKMTISIPNVLFSEGN